jgi:predicted permease
MLKIFVFILATVLVSYGAGFWAGYIFRKEFREPKQDENKLPNG